MEKERRNESEIDVDPSIRRDQARMASEKRSKRRL
jgi:hypothetical protein